MSAACTSASARKPFFPNRAPPTTPRPGLSHTRRPTIHGTCFLTSQRRQTSRCRTLMGFVLGFRRVDESYLGAQGLEILCSNKTLAPTPRSIERGKLTLLGHEQTESLLQRDPVPGPFVIGREARRMCRLGHLALECLLERVCSLARSVEVDHEMHLGVDGPATAGIVRRWGFVLFARWRQRGRDANALNKINGC